MLEGVPQAMRTEIESRVADFQTRRDDISQLVREGEMTLKAARQRTNELAGELHAFIQKSVENLRNQRPVISVRLAETLNKLRRASHPEDLQRKTVELLANNLVELQIANRKAEFESKTYTRSSATSVPAPSFDKLFELFDSACESGDSAAVEWARRQLEQMRHVAVAEELRERIDIVCDRPGTLNRRLIEKYQHALSARLGEPGFAEAFLEKALDQNDANAAAALVEMVRKIPDAVRPDAANRLAEKLEQLPARALAYVTQVDKDVRQHELEALDQFQANCQEWISDSAALNDLKQPSEADLARQARLASLPAMALGQPVGLVIGQQGQPQSTEALAPSFDEEKQAG